MHQGTLGVKLRAIRYSEAMVNEPQGLAAVLGKNAKKLRTDECLTLDDVAIAARQVGLKWSNTRVADFEAGRVAPSLQTLLAYCSAMASLGYQVRLADLARSSGAVVITDSLTMPIAQLKSLLEGDAFQPPKGPAPATARNAYPAEPASECEREWQKTLDSRRHLEAIPNASKIRMRSGSIEASAQRTLAFSPEGFALLSELLWHRTFSEERNARAGPEANAQTRGQVSRKLLAEAKAAVRSGDNQ